jgi:hypothetical protein
VASSYVAANCNDLLSSGYKKVVNAGPDKCSKEIPTVWIHRPGILANGTSVGAPTATEIELRSLSCPANATLKEEDGGVLI